MVKQFAMFLREPTQRRVLPWKVHIWQWQPDDPRKQRLWLRCSNLVLNELRLFAGQINCSVSGNSLGGAGILVCQVRDDEPPKESTPSPRRRAESTAR